MTMLRYVGWPLVVYGVLFMVLRFLGLWERPWWWAVVTFGIGLVLVGISLIIDPREKD